MRRTLNEDVSPDAKYFSHSDSSGDEANYHEPAIYESDREEDNQEH